MTNKKHLSASDTLAMVFMFGLVIIALFYAPTGFLNHPIQSALMLFIGDLSGTVLLVDGMADYYLKHPDEIKNVKPNTDKRFAGKTLDEYFGIVAIAAMAAVFLWFCFDPSSMAMYIICYILSVVFVLVNIAFANKLGQEQALVEFVEQSRHNQVKAEQGTQHNTETTIDVKFDDSTPKFSELLKRFGKK